MSYPTESWGQSERANHGKRFSQPTTGQLVRARKLTYRVLIKCHIARAAENEFSNQLQYFFQINPLEQDARGDDRTFTVQTYTSVNVRSTEKHSQERKELAKLLRDRHKYIWNLYHTAMELDE